MASTPQHGLAPPRRAPRTFFWLWVASHVLPVCPRLNAYTADRVPLCLHRSLMTSGTRLLGSLAKTTCTRQTSMRLLRRVSDWKRLMCSRHCVAPHAPPFWLAGVQRQPASTICTRTGEMLEGISWPFRSTSLKTAMQPVGSARSCTPCVGQLPTILRESATRCRGHCRTFTRQTRPVGRAPAVWWAMAVTRRCPVTTLCLRLRNKRTRCRTLRTATRRCSNWWTLQQLVTTLRSPLPLRFSWQWGSTSRESPH